MARPKSVTPHLQPNAKTYTATFTNATGKRVNRSLHTKDKSQADAICMGLTALARTQPASPADPAIPQFVSSRAIALFFGDTPSDNQETVAADGFHLATAAARSAFPNLAPEDLAKITDVYVDRHRYAQENNRLRLDLAHLEAATTRLAQELANLKLSALARAVSAGNAAPPLSDAIAQFAQHIQASVSRNHAADVIRSINNFQKSLDPSISIADITPAMVASYLDAWSVAGAPTRRLARRDAEHRKIGRFLNWSAQQWSYPSPMQALKPPSQLQLSRERGEIHWHSIDEVEKAIAALPPGPYWPALVATLAYAGLQLAELAWLRRSDLDITSQTLWITPINDSTDPSASHPLKTAHRKRAVKIHPRLLWPRLSAWLNAAGPLNEVLFPMPRPRRRASPGHPARWSPNSLSKTLNGNKGGTSRRPSRPLLPIGMNAKSLRRTFGSLLIRSGKSGPEVAAALGNTEAIVRQHYARILGQEVQVDF